MHKREFEILFRVNYPRFKNYASRFVESAVAEDLIQDVFLNFWNKKRDDKIENPASYLFMSVRNACYNHLRKTMIESRFSDLSHPGANDEKLYVIDYADVDDYKPIKDELMDEIEAVIDRLPPRCKEAFVLSRFKGMKNREVAERMGISEKVVEKHNSRAFRILRKHFRKS